MSILVTGGAGYIGSHTAHMLCDAGEDVVLEYSLDGVNFINIATYDSEAFASFTSIQVDIPAAAQSAGTQFRWRQLSNSGAGCQ